MCNLSHQLVVNMGEIFASIRKDPRKQLLTCGTRYFRRPLPFSANISPNKPHADEINSVS